MLAVWEVNDLDREQFCWLFGNVVEKWPQAADHVYQHVPFRSALHISQEINAYLDSLSASDKEDLLRLYPEIGSDMKAAGEDTSREHEDAGLHCLADAQRDIMHFLNARYRERFCFPFVICVQDTTLPDIMVTLESRYFNTLENELKTAIEEVKKIARLRIMDLVWH